MIGAAALIAVGVAAFLIWVAARKREEDGVRARSRAMVREAALAAGPVTNDDRRSDGPRRWDWLTEVEYPYFAAYERHDWPATPEYDLGSRPWIYP